MSTEGGVATLFRDAFAHDTSCRITAVHFGETGKAMYIFRFGSRLRSAERRLYRYDLPISENAHIKSLLTEKTTLADRKGRHDLPKDFLMYKAFFDPRNLAQCSKL